MTAKRPDEEAEIQIDYEMKGLRVTLLFL